MSHWSRSISRSVSPNKTKHSKTSKSFSEQNELREKAKHKRSSSSDRPISAQSGEHNKSKKIRLKSRKSSTSSESSVGSQNDSLCSSRNSNQSKEKKKLKKLERKKRKKEKKLKKKCKKEKRKLRKASAASVTNREKAVDAKPEALQNEKPDDPADQLLMDRARAMAPMTKEEWEKRQSVIRRVYDEETGRHRLIKGDGEILEEIVSREQHREINRQATKGDSAFFQSTMAAKLKK